MKNIVHSFYKKIASHCCSTNSGENIGRVAAIVYEKNVWKWHMKNVGGLLLLAAIWGGSFLFIRIAVPAFGPVMLMEFRVLLGAIFLSAVGITLKQQPQLWKRKKHYLILGWFNSALPFLLFAYAAQTIEVSTLAILNATAPFWGVCIGYILCKEGVAKASLFGCVFGLIGVSVLVGVDLNDQQDVSYLPTFAILGATLSYAIASHYTKASANVGALNNAHGSLWGAAILIIPFIFLFPYNIKTDTQVVWSVLLLGLICTGAAYILYFKLINSMGAQPALSVTFLIPLFGVLWGYLVLDEALTMYTFIGGAFILVGVGLVTGLSQQVCKGVMFKLCFR